MWVYVLLVLVVAGLVGFRMFSKTQASRRAYLARRAAIESMPIDEARQRAEAATVDWRRVVSTVGAELDFKQSLGPLTTEFLAKYTQFDSPNGAHCLGAKHIARSQYRPEMLTIGKSDYRDICVLPNSDVVHVIDGSESDDTSDDSYPSVHHLLVDYAETES